MLTYTVLPAGAESDTAGTSGAAKRGGAGHDSANQDDAEHDAAKSGTGRNEENDTAGQTAADNSSPARPQFDDLTLHKVITALRELEDEDPLLHVVWVERLAEIHVQLMGAVQLEIIQQIMHDRFGLDVTFGPGSILYKETIAAPVEGVGHFEPLRHYAETHVLLEPLPQGAGMAYATVCSEDVLDRNWQRLIMQHFQEREHLGCSPARRSPI